MDDLTAQETGTDRARASRLTRRLRQRSLPSRMRRTQRGCGRREYNVLVKSPVEATRGSVLLIIGNSPFASLGDHQISAAQTVLFRAALN
jgi:hypothetical protein